MSVIVIDDTHPSIRYSSDWEWPKQSDPMTVHMTWDIGASAVFVFTGTAVSVIGNVHEGFHDERINMEFSLDGATPTPALRICVERNITNEVWYSAGNLDDREHTLMLKYLGADDIPFELDRIEYVGKPQPIISGSDGGTGGTTEGGNAGSGQSPGTVLGVSEDAFPVGAVVGSVVGGVAFLLLSAVLLFRVRRRRRRARPHPGAEKQDATSSSVEPFNLESGHTRSYSGITSSSMLETTTSSAPLHPGYRSKAALASSGNNLSPSSPITGHSSSLEAGTSFASFEQHGSASSPSSGYPLDAKRLYPSNALASVVGNPSHDSDSMLGALEGLPPAYTPQSPQISQPRMAASQGETVASPSSVPQREREGTRTNAGGDHLPAYG